MKTPTTGTKGIGTFCPSPSFFDFFAKPLYFQAKKWYILMWEKMAT